MMLPPSQQVILREVSLGSPTMATLPMCQVLAGLIDAGMNVIRVLVIKLCCKMVPPTGTARARATTSHAKLKLPKHAADLWTAPLCSMFTFQLWTFTTESGRSLADPIPSHPSRNSVFVSQNWQMWVKSRICLRLWTPGDTRHMMAH